MAIKKTAVDQAVEAIAGVVQRSWRDMEDMLKRIPATDQAFAKEPDLKKVVNNVRAAARLVVPDGTTVPADMT